MPWCDECSKFWNPNSMPPDGTCPKCGQIIADPPDSKVPWHFWVFVVALTIYLGWRVVQGIQWLIDNDHPLWAGVTLVALAGMAVGGLIWWRSEANEVGEPG